MRIIVDRDETCHWAARWNDERGPIYRSGSVLGAVAKLIIHSPERHVSTSDLVTDPMASHSGHVEMVVLRGG